MQKYCTKCGEELLPNNKFCVSCGAKIENTNINNKHIKKINSAEKNVGTVIIICVIVFIFIPLLGFLLVGLLSSNDSHDYSNQNINLNYGILENGIVVTTDRNLNSDFSKYPTIFLIDDGLRRPITEEMFLYCEFRWKDIKLIDKNILQAIPKGKFISQYEPGITRGKCYIPISKRVIRKFPDGTLIQPYFKYWDDNADDHTIYLIKNGERRPFVSREVFEALGYRFSDDYKNTIMFESVTEEELYQYPIGAIITLDNPQLTDIN